MKKIIKEILRLKVPIGLVIIGALFWGLKESFQTASLLLFFLGMSVILGHWLGKEVFRGYGWDVGERLRIAWEARFISRSILAVGMLFARVLIYVAVVIAMALLTMSLLRGAAFGLTSPIPYRAVPLLPILAEEHRRIWPESDVCIIAGQIQAESNWKETAKRREPSGVTSYGLMQVLDRTFLEMRSKHDTLADVEPVQMLQARYGIRAGIIYDRGLWKTALCPETERMRWHYLLREYNGGRGLLRKEIARAGTCEPVKVDAECRRRVLKLKNGNLDLCVVNTRYPRDIFKNAERYRGRVIE